MQTSFNITCLMYDQQTNCCFTQPRCKSQPNISTTCNFKEYFNKTLVKKNLVDDWTRAGRPSISTQRQDQALIHVGKKSLICGKIIKTEIEY